jgi:hypothetical protein
MGGYKYSKEDNVERVSKQVLRFKLSKTGDGSLEPFCESLSQPSLSIYPPFLDGYSLMIVNENPEKDFPEVITYNAEVYMG